MSNLQQCKKCGYAGWCSPKVTLSPYCGLLLVQCRRCGGAYYEKPLDVTTQIEVEGSK